MVSGSSNFLPLQKLSNISQTLSTLIASLPPAPTPPPFEQLIHESLRLSTLSAPPNYLPEVTPIIGFGVPCVRVEEIKLGMGGWEDPGVAPAPVPEVKKEEDPPKDDSIELRPEDIAALEKEAAERRKKKEEKRRKKEEKRALKRERSKGEEDKDPTSDLPPPPSPKKQKRQTSIMMTLDDSDSDE